MTKKRALSAIVSAVIFILVGYAWYLMFTHAKGETFAQRGFASLKYFTVDSNLLMGLSALVHLIFSLKAGGSDMSEWVETFFFAAVTSVSLTFGMVMIYLGPVFGYGDMFQNANLYFHLIIPVLSILSLCILHRDRTILLKESFVALIPLLIYGVYYLGMIIHYGLNRPKTDWYYLAFGGEKWIPAMLLLIVSCTWGIALLLRLAVNGISEKLNNSN